MSTQFRVLGPVEVVRDGEPVPLHAAKPRTVLAALLLHANEFVPTRRLVTAVWGEDPPAKARSVLHTYLMRLRQLVRGDGPGPSPIQTLPGGYLIETSPETLDLDRFRQLVKLGRQAADRGDLETESRLLAEARRLWRDAPLCNVDSDALQREEVARLTEERMLVSERRVDVELALGRHREMVGELRTLTSEHPLRERFWARLMTALARCGRQSEALEAYQEVRRLLADELGIDPSPELQRLQFAVLNGASEPGAVAEPAPAPAPPPAEPPASPAVRGCQLPMDVADFVGRQDLVDQIAEELLRAGGCEAPSGAAVHGAPGIGKTALAIRVGHSIRGHFPDGAWFVSLRDAGGAPREPGEVLAELLRMLAVPEAEVPATTPERAAAFRACLSGRRVLLLLDDAADVDQVRPMLPGNSGCAVLVTGRAPLLGLTALYGFASFLLDVLSQEESTDLLERIAGAERVRAEADAAGMLVALCGRLPLALRIAAAHLTGRRDQTIAELVMRLRGGELTARLSLGPGSSVSFRAALDPAYAQLSADARRLFRVLGLAGRPNCTSDQAALLLGVSVEAAERPLGELVAGGLLQCPGPGRFLLHDLLRSYAREQAGRGHPSLDGRSSSA